MIIFMATSFLLLLLLNVLVLSSFPFSSSSSSATFSSLSKGSSLSVENPTHVLISPNNLFSSGFYPLGENAYGFAIWFTKPSSHGNHTLVWLANRDQPINGRLSKLSLLKNGNLILIDADQSILWATNTASISSVQLLLLDNGNLILSTSDNVLLWQSFDSPTDTLLPQQPLTRHTQLVSSRSRTNYSSGLYKLFFDDDNVLRLVFDGPETSSIYWPDAWLSADNDGRSRYNDTRIAEFDLLGHFLSSDKLEFRAADYGAGPQRRLVLDFDGNLRLYSLKEETGDWVVSWQAKSKACRIHGACGLNGMCRYSAGFGRDCSCLPGFRIRDPTDWSRGCEPEFNLSCNQSEENFTFFKVPNADFYGYDIQILLNYTLRRCLKTCLDSCDCKGFHHRFNQSSGVYDCNPKWVLRNGHWSPSLAGDLFVKVPQIPLNKDFLNKLDCSGTANMVQLLDRVYERRHKNGLLTFLVWFAAAVGCVEVTTICLVWCFLNRNGTHPDMGGGYIPAATGFKRFTYNELKQATRGFRDEVGRGGGGVVYKGVLPDCRVAAIKRLREANQGEAEFLAEVSTIGRLNHMNLIQLWGYCAEGRHKLLVYEYMANGSLSDNLNSKTLDWDTRFQIAVGTAKGLAYLHEECLEWVLHCDIKPQNILLDSNYQPKVADFGLSKLLNRGGGGSSSDGNNSSFSKIRGTRGYMAPEWIFNLPITSKVDVYSYGVVMLEMVTGKSPTSAGEIEQRRLIKWAREKVSTGAAMESWIEEIVDPVISGKYDVPKMQILVAVALKCVEEDKDARPSMTQVLEMLQYHESN